MKLSTIITVAAIALICFATVTVPTGCASIVPPLGGPRDSLPPVLLNANPADSVLNFTGKKIVLTFDEFIQLESVQQSLIVSPTPKLNPIIDAKLRLVTINIKDTLQPNTTYSFNFGNSIKDVNEGNTFRNFTYILSTGSYLDSLHLSGKVIIAETGKVDTTILVMLYNSMDDSAVVKDKPRYVTRIDSTGSFMFNNLPPANFAVYAWKDEGARRYLSKSQLFAFNDSSVSSQSQKNDIMLYAFEEKDTSTKTPSVIVKSNAKKPKQNQDSTIRIRTNLNSDQLDLLSNLEISFEPDSIISFDSTKAQLSVDSFQTVTGYSWLRDTSNRKVTLVYPWKENTRYNLILDSMLVTDSMGRRLARLDTISFETKREGEYGLVRLRFLNLALNKNPVLQFIQGDQVKFSYTFKNSNQFYAKLFAPGEYELRLVFDDNKNGVWDTGSFFGKHLQPEKVQLIKRKLNVKANWDNEVDIQL